MEFGAFARFVGFQGFNRASYGSVRVGLSRRNIPYAA